jgi:uncharacterized membrane protein (UPF0127 family)
VLRRALSVGVGAVALAACAASADTGDDGVRTVPTDPLTSSAVGSPDAAEGGPADDQDDAEDDGDQDGVQPEGFTTITARITEADGEVCEVCLWLADTVEERGRGLMGVTDLGDAAGMVFRFDEPVVNSFFMLNTPTPLSIAWFSPDGEFAAATDMEPCLEVPDEGCPLYGPGTRYELALEVFRGDLAELGVGPGARLELIEGTEADRCPDRS